MIVVWKIVKADCTGCGLMPGFGGLLQATRSDAPEFVQVGEVLCQSCQTKRYAAAEAAQAEAALAGTTADLPLSDNVIARAHAARTTATTDGYIRLASDVAAAA